MADAPPPTSRRPLRLALTAHPEEILEVLARHGYHEFKREVTGSDRLPEATGGLWQGLNDHTGSVASVIWLRHGLAPDAASVFIDIDGPLSRVRPDA